MFCFHCGLKKMEMSYTDLMAYKTFLKKKNSTQIVRFQALQAFPVFS